MAFPKTFAELKDAGYRFSDHGVCRGCKQEIEWWETPRGKMIPLELMREPRSPVVPHHATCTHVDQFRKPRGDEASV
jgi:hypothetical protein